MDIAAWLRLLEGGGPYDDYFYCPLFAGKPEKHEADASLPSDWRQWPSDDFPTSRIDYDAVTHLSKDCPLPLQERWSKARGLLTDPRQWNWRIDKVKKEIFAKHRRAVPAGALMRHLDKLTAAGILKREARDKIKIFLKAFEVPKIKKLRVRLIINAIPTNDLTGDPMGMHLPTERDVEEAVLNFNYFLEVDGTSYYNQFPLTREVAAYFGLRIGDGNFVWCTGPMGWKEMPAAAQACTDVIAYHPGPGRTLGYLDNVYATRTMRSGSTRNTLKPSGQKSELECGRLTPCLRLRTVRNNTVKS